MEWEYKTVKARPQGFLGGIVDEAHLNAVLNGLGRDGWELTTSFATHEGYGKTRDIILMLKRPRATTAKAQM